MKASARQMKIGEMSDAQDGGCLCGAVRYRARGALRDVVNYHCGQCRRTHGHVAAYTAVEKSDLDMLEDRGLKWYRSSDRARRGFCSECGGSIFFEFIGKTVMSIAAGTLDGPTGLRTVKDIHIEDSGDYYQIDAG